MRFGVLALLLLPTPSLATDADNLSRALSPSQREWVESLKSPAGELCCFDADGYNVDWRSKGATYEVYHDGKWTVVPPSAVLTVINRIGVPRAWFRLDGSVRCFLPGGGF